MKQKETKRLICGLSIELLSAYLDDELDEKKRRRLEAHLQACPECKRELEELKAVDTILREEEVEEPSSDFLFNLNKRVMARIERQKRMNIFYWFWVLVPTAAAAILIIFLNYQRPIKSVGMGDRLAFTEIKDEPSRELKVELGIPSITLRPPLTKIHPRTEARIKKEKESETTTPPTAIVLSPDKSGGLLLESEVDKEKVIRAIIDSTGRVLRVAKGGSIIPERDTTLERQLQGRQLAPPSIRGKSTQMFVDFVAAEEDSD